MSDNNVVDFPQEFAPALKFTNKVKDKTSKGKKVTQREAMEALGETHNLMGGIMHTMRTLSQAQASLENVLNHLGTNFSVLTGLLKDKEMFDDSDWEIAWDKYVTQPQEESLDRHLETLKQQSAEDAFFVEVISMVRTHDWQDQVEDGQTYPAKEVNDFYMRMLLNPATRHQCLPDLRKIIPEVPELNLESEVDDRQIDDQRQMPDCKYCGLDDCEFCNPPKTSEEDVECQ